MWFEFGYINIIYIYIYILNNYIILWDHIYGAKYYKINQKSNVFSFIYIQILTLIIMIDINNILYFL